MLEVTALTGGWGQTTIVENLSLTVPRSISLAILGRNGVGKSTLLELLVGRALRHSGSIVLDGEDLSACSIHHRAHAGIGYVPQAREVFPSLTVRENILVAARPGFWTEKRILELFPSLGRRIGNPAGKLSGGEQQMLSIARALSSNPKLLLMDEPSEGLAPIVVEQLVDAIKSLSTSGNLAIVLVEQRADIALSLSDQCIIMDRGQIVHSGTSADLAADEQALTQLMGLTAQGHL
ncbi:ABC transporter ATP-binding protein [Methylocella sp. CPCC 101449]|uniref:ABC transporter ATP-binding protein n=1 Tax=Methylocella sp. CPCC 101449 TaxID=2987531 RepID=UPI00288E1303|nr:ABC transporter ATP-binding protein [Methylocella sp. CPCC 101449]MDT2023891.1 ABC transporter ATP-binding protein [Methylocella sp. CPCC 101449]